MFAVSDQVFQVFLNSVSQSPQNSNQEAELENHAKFLLIKVHNIS